SVRPADLDRYRTLADLRGRRVATLGGTVAYEILLAAARDHQIEPVSFEDDTHPYSDLVLGRVDAVLLDTILAQRMLLKFGGCAMQPASVDVGHYVGILAPGNTALRDRINELIKASMRDGSLERILRKWHIWNDDQPGLHRQVLAGASIPPTVGAG